MIKKITVILLVFLSFFFFWKIRKKIVSPDSDQKQSLQEKKSKYNFQWIKWKDPAGFSFQYPKEIKIENHPDDETNYARLTFLVQNHPGKIDIICNDAKGDDIEQWFKNNEKTKTASLLKTEIASSSGRKAILGENKEMTAFIDWDKVIYIIEVDAQDEDYWQPIYKKILESFELIPLEGETEAQFQDWFKGFDTSGADIVEPVEIIQ